MLRVEDQADIRVLRLDRAPVNALDQSLLQAIATAVSAAPSDGARGLILTGSGHRFSAGLDLRALLAADADGLSQFLGAFLDCLYALAASTVPVVAAINGHSPAGGAVLALHCDRRIMIATDALIGLNELAVGLCPGPLIHQVLVRMVGQRHAGSMLTSGVMLSAGEAHTMGLVDELVEPHALEERALSWLRGVVALPKHAYDTTRRLVRADLVRLLATAVGAERAAITAAFVRDWLNEETRTTLMQVLARRTSGR